MQSAPSNCCEQPTQLVIPQEPPALGDHPPLQEEYQLLQENPDNPPLPSLLSVQGQSLRNDLTVSLLTIKFHNSAYSQS